jgi:hypothetical protein
MSTALEKALGVIETKDAARARLVDALEGNLPDNIRASMDAALDAIDKGVPQPRCQMPQKNKRRRIIRGMDSGKMLAAMEPQKLRKLSPVLGLSRRPVNKVRARTPAVNF